MMKKVLVTGAAGFVGSHICEQLLKEGYDVVGLFFGNKQAVGHLEKNKNFYPVSADIRNFQDVFTILKEHNPQGIFHTAALLPDWKGSDDPFDFFEVNVRGTFNLLESCRLLDINKFIYSSTTSAYGRDKNCFWPDEKSPTNPSDFYEFTKIEGENLCRLYHQKYGIKIIALRYAGIFGPGKNKGAVANFVKNALAGKPLEILSDISWNIVFVGDVVKANILAFEKLDELDFEIINIGSNKEINIKELARKIIKISGSKSKLEIRKGAPQFCLSVNVNKAKKILKFKPLSVDESLKQMFSLI